MRHTLWVLVVRLLEVLDHAVLTNQLLDLALRLDVERILIEESNLVLALALGILYLLLPHREDLPPAASVICSVGKLRVACA